MPIPKSLFLSMLKLAGEHSEISMKDAREHIARELDLTEEEINERFEASSNKKFANRLAWACVHLKLAGLLEAGQRGYVKITAAGRDVLSNPPLEFNYKFLHNIPAYAKYREQKKIERQDPQLDQSNFIEEEKSEKPPHEIMEDAHGEIETVLADEILEKVIALSPSSFEQLILKVLEAMGYGGGRNRGRRLGRAGDDGVDGVIDQDALGLDRVYMQAKRYQTGNTVGSSSIRDLAGSLGMHRASKGLFVTTSSFTPAARKTVSQVDKHIVLVDGQELARLMIRHGVGCREKQRLYVMELDEDFFENI